MNACSSRIDELHAEAAKQEALAAQRDGEASVVEHALHHNAESVERIKGELAQSYASETDMDAELAQKETAEQEKRALAAQKKKEYVAYTEKLETLRRGMDESSGKADAVALRIASITASLSGASLISGAGLFSIGISILAILAVFCFCKWIVLVLAHFIQNMSRKRSVK